MSECQLPWALQESWGCEETTVDIIIENDYLRAAVTPQWGGKFDLYNKKLKRQILQ